jgi:rhodanese-related sulfurtransferase
MPREVFRDEVQRLVTEGVQLVEVLPTKAYEEGHLPGAVNLPLRRLSRERGAALRPDQPIVVYCWDYQ